MKYRLKIYYRTPVMDKVTGYIQKEALGDPPPQRLRVIIEEEE